MEKKTLILSIIKLVITGLVITALSVLWILSTVNAKADIDIQVIMPNTSSDEALEIIKNRNGSLVIEIVEGVAYDNQGNGGNNDYYIKYDENEFSKGDEVISIFVYNPCTNYADDILHRVDLKK